MGAVRLPTLKVPTMGSFDEIKLKLITHNSLSISCGPWPTLPLSEPDIALKGTAG